MTNPAANPRRLPLFATAWALLVAAPSGAFASEDPFAGLAALDQGQLASHRGGMMIGDIPVNFAVTIRTTVQQATRPLTTLQTTLVIDNSGRLAGSTTTVGMAAPGNPAVAPGGMPISVSTGPAAPALSSADPAANIRNGGTTTVAIGNATNVIQQISSNQVQTLIANAANNVSISHSTSINAVLPSFLQANKAFTSQFQAAQLGYQAALAAVRR